MTDERRVDIVDFAGDHLSGVLAICAAEGWDEYSEDPELTRSALTAPGTTTLVGVDDEDTVVAFIQVQSDGVLQAHVSALLVTEAARGAGVGRRLLREGLDRAGGIQIDIRTRTEDFYQRLGASQSLGFRLRREDLGLGEARGRPDAG